MKRFFEYEIYSIKYYHEIDLSIPVMGMLKGIRKIRVKLLSAECPETACAGMTHAFFYLRHSLRQTQGTAFDRLRDTSPGGGHPSIYFNISLVSFHPESFGFVLEYNPK
jgi:hypothetical protein